PSYLMCTSAPTSSLRCSAGMSGVPPSRRVTTGAPSSIGRRSAYSVMTPRHWGAPMSASFHSHDGGDLVDLVQAREGGDRGGKGGVACRMGDDDQLGARSAPVAAHLLADGLDGDALVREDLRD